MPSLYSGGLPSINLNRFHGVPEPNQEGPGWNMSLTYVVDYATR
jgi:hypothetical protein